MGRTIKSVASAVASPAVAMNKGIFNAATGGDQPDPNNLVNQVDPRLKDIRDRQIKQATDYRSNLAGYRDEQTNLAKDASRNNLAQSIRQSNTNANARGLLYGGYRESQEGNARAQSASDLNHQVADINTSTENQAEQLENQALGSGMQVQNLEQNRNNQLYNTALQQQQQKASGVRGVVNFGSGLLSGGFK